MERILLVGHGSPKKDANQMDVVGRMLHDTLHPGCSDNCVMTSYLQFESPGLKEKLQQAADDGAERVIVHPYFLSAGMHVTSDIPGVIDEVRAEFPDVEFIYTEPLGVSQRLVQVIVDRIEEASGMKPHEIEEASFRILSDESSFADFPQNQRPVIKRVIHATADFGFKETLMFHPRAVEAGIKAIRAGKNILVDIEMVRAGINKKLLAKRGGEVICRISDVVAKEGQTRSEAAFEQALDDSVGIVVVGNAPTALVKCMDMIEQGLVKPDLVIGVPVGFVRSVESKARLASQSYPFISNAGRKGGTPVAVAITNAIIKLAVESK